MIHRCMIDGWEIPHPLPLFRDSFHMIKTLKNISCNFSVIPNSFCNQITHYCLVPNQVFKYQSIFI